MNIVFVSPEAVPYAKTGGLADVAGLLPLALARHAHVDLIVPDYSGAVGQDPSSPPRRREVIDEFPVAVGSRRYTAQLRRLTVARTLAVYFVGQDLFFARKFLYGSAEGDYADNFLRFLFFQRAVVEFLRRRRGRVQIVHANDWQTGLIPLLMRQPPWQEAFVSCRSVFSIHNLGYQGLFPGNHFHDLELPGSLFTPDYLEFFGQINFLKAGIVFADRLLTVSPTYAREIQEAESGFGLDGLLRRHAGKLSGILNGVDDQIWNPGRDPHLYQTYSAATLERKRRNKEGLLDEHGLPFDPSQPWVAFIGRLAQQKGVDLLLEALPAMMREELCLLVLGSGDEAYAARLRQAAARYKRRLRFFNRFDEPLAHRLEAAADMLVMPSLYEPCGLNQLYSLKYGTVPLVRAVGGLADSVTEFDAQRRRGTGFLFSGRDGAALLACLRRALSVFADREAWTALQRNGMRQDFSWHKTAVRYMELYRSLHSEELADG